MYLFRGPAESFIFIRPEQTEIICHSPVMRTDIRHPTMSININGPWSTETKIAAVSNNGADVTYWTRGTQEDFQLTT